MSPNGRSGSPVRALGLAFSVGDIPPMETLPELPETAATTVPCQKRAYLRSIAQAVCIRIQTAQAGGGTTGNVRETLVAACGSLARRRRTGEGCGEGVIVIFLPQRRTAGPKSSD